MNPVSETEIDLVELEEQFAASLKSVQPGGRLSIDAYPAPDAGTTAVLDQAAVEAAGGRAAGIPRWIEVPLSVLALLLASPLLLLMAAAIRTSSKGPAIFRQTRVGLAAEPFTLFKLRTMYVNSTGPQVTSGSDPRITPIGRFLRRSKLDELPEFWNVIRGDMSLVGPRPEVPKYCDTSDPAWREILSWRPGLTDPVTLGLRNEQDMLAATGADAERFYRDVLQPRKLAGYIAYLRRRTVWSDLGVFWSTLARLAFDRSSRGAPGPK